MELLLLLLPLALLAGLSGGGGESAGAEEEEPAPTASVRDGSGMGDLMEGEAGRDLLLGAGGYDDMFGLDGADLLAGEAGHDALSGGAGADVLLGGAAQDTLLGGSEDDLLFGGTGADSLSGDPGDDLLIGHSGADTLSGGIGADTLVGLDAGSDTALDSGVLSAMRAGFAAAFPEATSLQINRVMAAVNLTDDAEAGTDLLQAGDGDDTLLFDDGDTAFGGAGADAFVTRSTGGAAMTVVSDFAPGSDSVVILMDDPVGAVLSLDGSTTPGSTVIRIDGVAVSLLSGVIPADIPTGAITLDAA